MSPIIAICTYRVAGGKEHEFEGLITRHWPTLREEGLVTDAASQIFKGGDKPGEPVFTEVLEWVNGEAPDIAHLTPRVMALWEPMGLCCEARDGRPPMEFLRAERLR